RISIFGFRIWVAGRARLRMEQAGLTRKDIVPYFGARSRISEIFNHRRKISPKIAKNLHKGLKIPSDILIEAMA
ncbi:MAG: hypothetical protein WCP55_11670, partial [Lentisphaerota bacterium]